MARGGLMDLASHGQVHAVLGPTNTGKTHRALTRMMGHRSGMIGLPLRLLAREVYDRVVAEVGEQDVALITGEERRVGAKARFWICTVEAMPVDKPVAFLAVDEIQLAGDRARGHVFTDRLLNARGVVETWFLGSSTIEPLLRTLVPTAQVHVQQRLSTLRFAGHRKLTSLPPRTAVVAFSTREVYQLAERLRGKHGGAAVVLGALSPRARNAQVELYAAGDVQYMVATDAIGMGLNLDVHHVALAGRSKFDGVGHRDLREDELAQIAGRAGRYTRDGTFGTTFDCAQLDTETTDRIEQHVFPALRTLYWRSAEMCFDSVPALQESLRAVPRHRSLRAVHDADDAAVLDRLARHQEVLDRAKTPDSIALLWKVCRVPDFGNTLPEHHAGLLAQVYVQLIDHGGTLPDAWLSQQVARLKRTDGGLDTLMARIAGIRIWTTVANHADWVRDGAAWRARTRLVEDKLSDALHAALTARFVDREASVLVRRLSAQEDLTASLAPGGRVVAAGLELGVLRGLRFEAKAAQASAAGLKAARRVVSGLVRERLQALCDSPDGAFSVSRDGTVRWDGAPVARLVKGAVWTAPHCRTLRHDLLDGRERAMLDRRLQAWAGGWLAARHRPLSAADPTTPAERGLLFALRAGEGWARCQDVAGHLRALQPAQRATLTAQSGVRFGTRFVYVPRMVEAVRARAVLWAVAHGESPSLPSDDGRIPHRTKGSAAMWRALGFVQAGTRPDPPYWVRVDVLERLGERGEAEAAVLQIPAGVFEALRPDLPIRSRAGGTGRKAGGRRRRRGGSKRRTR